MSSSISNAELRARVDAFVSDLSDLIRQSALEAVRLSLGGDTGAPVARRGRKPGRPAKAAAGRPARKGGRTRRSSEDLGQISGSFLTYVKGNPGQRLEEIGTGMGVHTKELKRPVQLLLAEGSIRTEGQRRGTRYFAGGGGPGRKAKAGKKAAKRKSGRKKGKRKGGKKAAA